MPFQPAGTRFFVLATCNVRHSMLLLCTSRQPFTVHEQGDFLVDFAARPCAVH